MSLSPEQLAARKRRSIWIALSVGGFMLLVFFITMAKFKAGAP